MLLVAADEEDSLYGTRIFSGVDGKPPTVNPVHRDKAHHSVDLILLHRCAIQSQPGGRDRHQLLQMFVQAGRLRRDKHAAIVLWFRLMDGALRRGHPDRRCTCSDRDAARYVEKISGPLLDRIDLHVTVPSVEYDAMRRRETPEDSATVKARVDAARAIQTKRLQGTGAACNAQMTPAQLGEYCRLDEACDTLMKNAFQRLGLTARSHDRILRVARTIADLDASPDITPVHLAEAIQFRNTDILKG